MTFDPTTVALGREPWAGPFNEGCTARLSGLTNRQVRYWRESGLITPIAEGGRGVAYLYDAATVVWLRTIRARLASGASLQQIRKSLPSKADPSSIVASAQSVQAERTSARGPSTTPKGKGRNGSVPVADTMTMTEARLLDRAMAKERAWQEWGLVG